MREGNHASPRPNVATIARARAPKPARGRTCPTCGGRGQVVSSRGIFSIAQTCPHCQGAGRVIDSPCKTCDGKGRRERSQQNQTAHPCRRGHRLAAPLLWQRGGRLARRPSRRLYVVLHVRPHEIFQRDGDDLLCEMPVSFVQAALGAEIEVPTLDGKAPVRIPAGTQPGTMFRLKGKGVKNVQGYGSRRSARPHQCRSADSLSAAQKAKLQEFADLCSGKESPISQRFFEKAKKLFQ